jgi:hypothetical protein
MNQSRADKSSSDEVPLVQLLSLLLLEEVSDSLDPVSDSRERDRPLCLIISTLNSLKASSSSCSLAVFNTSRNDFAVSLREESTG